MFWHRLLCQEKKNIDSNSVIKSGCAESLKVHSYIFCAEIVNKIFTSFHISGDFGEDVTFPLFTKFNTKTYLSYLSVNRIPN